MPDLISAEDGTAVYPALRAVRNDKKGQFSTFYETVKIEWDKMSRETENVIRKTSHTLIKAFGCLFAIVKPHRYR